MIRSVNIVKNTRKYKYLFVKKIGLILIAMTAGFVWGFFVYTRLRLVRTSFTYCYQTVPMDSICGYFYSKYDKKLFHMQSKMYINIWFFVVVGWSKFIKIRRHSICWEWNSNELYLVQLRIMTHQHACQIYHLLSYKNILKVYI